jgi:NAD+ kinase
MQKPSAPPERIAVAWHPDIPDAAKLAPDICQRFEACGRPVEYCTSIYDDLLRQHVINQDIDLLIALGGDGTMLRAGRLGAMGQVPVLGINTGHFGFLMEVDTNNWQEFIPLLIEGKYWMEERMMLSAQHVRQGQVLDQWNVLNEVVVCRGQIVRPIYLKTLVDGYELATYVADGLIASTPTGSTAYALAAGGPIMPPELRNILIIPVAPHLSVDRAVILPEGATVTIRVHTKHEAVFSIDGRSPVLMADGDEVSVTSGAGAALFVRFQDPGYFYRNLTSYMEQNPTAGGV